MSDSDKSVIYPMPSLVATLLNREQAKGCFPLKADYHKSFDPKDWAGSAAPPGSPGAPTPNPLLPGQRPPGSPQVPQGAQAQFVQTSNYFRLTSIVSIGSTEFNLYSLLYQDPQLQQVRPIQRSFTPD